MVDSINGAPTATSVPTAAELVTKPTPATVQWSTTETGIQWATDEPLQQPIDAAEWWTASDGGTTSVPTDGNSW